MDVYCKYYEHTHLEAREAWKSTSTPRTVADSTSSAGLQERACSSKKAASYISIFHMQGGAAERSGKILPGDTLMDVDGRPVSRQVMEYIALHTYDHL
jgi:hypothetical protein